MDFITFKEKLLHEDLKSVKPKQDMLDRLNEKYQDIDILGCYRLNENHTAIYFKHKLWEKMAIYRDGSWLETRVNSLKNKLPDATLEQLVKKLKKALTIIKIESVLPAEGEFYFYIIAKISGKKSVLHVSREGDILLRSKFMEYTITIDEEDDDDDDDDDDDNDDVEEVVVVIDEDDDMD